MMSKQEVFDHLGNKYASLTAMCSAYGIGRETFKRRIDRGMSIEKALTKPKITDHLGNQYSTISEMCKAYDIPPYLYGSRLKQGFTQERALTERKADVVDHLGNHYRTKKEMCSKYKICLRVFIAREKKGWPLKKILETPQNYHPKTCSGTDINKPGYRISDHLGNRFRSIEAMCRYYGINSRAYHARIRTGWSLERALTTPIAPNKRAFEEYVPPVMIIKDHLGNQYDSELEMCKHYNVGVYTYRKRIQEGLSVEEALTAPKRVTGRYTDPQGREFFNEKDLCKANNMSYGVYLSRRNKGYSIEQALTEPLHQYTTQDHLGNRYNSIREMCAFYHIDEGKYHSRRKLGWSLERALTFTKEKKKTEKVKHKYYDHYGNGYKTLTEMCERYHITIIKYKYRISHGYSIEEALTLQKVYRGRKHTHEKQQKQPASKVRIYVDYLGLEYDSLSLMCQSHNVSVSTYLGRRRLGWSLEEALATPIRGKNKK